MSTLPIGHNEPDPRNPLALVGGTEEATPKPRNVIRVPSDEQVIAPGETLQLSAKLEMSGTLLAVVVGPSARPIKLFAGRDKMDVPEDVAAWRPNLPVQAGKFVIMTVRNDGEEPAVFRALFMVDAPNHKVVVGSPQAPPPREEITAPRPAAHLGLTQAMPPEPTTTPEDHRVVPSNNEIALIVFRNEALVLMDNLRNNSPLTQNVRYGLIRRIEMALRPKAKKGKR